MGDEAAGLTGDLLDVTELSLRDLAELGESRLADALREVLDGADIGPSAGFSSRI